MPSPERPETMWQIAESIKGLGEAARSFEVPVISGNVSLYNETNGEGIQPTPLLAVVGLIDNCNRSTPSHFQREGDVVLLIGQTDEKEIGGSAYPAELHGMERGALTRLDFTLERGTCDLIRETIKRDLITSCHDLSQGGLGAALAECCFRDYQKPLGVKLNTLHDVRRPDCFLFSESGARFLVSCSPENAQRVKDLCQEHGMAISAEGVVGGDTIGVTGVAEIEAQGAFGAWFNGLSRLSET